jgi:Mn-dependent DtxR family transcriptional regulator
MPSVSQALQSLREKGLILHPAYGTVRLSDRGRRTAKAIHDRYEVLQRFFTRVLRVDERVASREACRIEHELGPDTHRRLKAFLDVFSQCRLDADRVIEHFHEYLEQ